MKKAIVIGAGFSGLSAASRLAKAGFKVTVLEKNSMPGGRARRYENEGFTFDMGPSWYWMPEVFEKHFAAFGKHVSDYYTLKRLDPSYRIYFGKDDWVDIPASFDSLCELFESLEQGAGAQLRKFIAEAGYKYDVAMEKFIYRPSLSAAEFMNLSFIGPALKMQIFSSFSKHLLRYFRSDRLRRMLEFPVLFLGGTPQTTPALYSLMNYADLKLGTWYPEGGMYRVVEGMVSLAGELGVEFKYNSPVEQIEIESGKARSVIAGGVRHDADVVIGAADYHHVEQDLLGSRYSRYSPAYWNKRTMSPSSLIFFIGLRNKLSGFLHHTLFFDTSFDKHAARIYDNPGWPDEPSLYFSCTSINDPSAAPEGMDNLYVLIPVAPGLEDPDSVREKYLHIVYERILKLTGQDIRADVVFVRSYAQSDFSADYHAFRGNAYGLANTLMQTAFLKPGMKSKKVSNLYYTGQLTVPGPGVPPAIISGQIAADLIVKEHGVK